MARKLQKDIEYKYKIPYYAPLKVGDIVRISNTKNLKRYEKSKEPYMNKLAVVIGYSTKSGAGPMTFAVRMLETGDEYLLYVYLLAKTGQRTHIPKFEKGDEVISKSKKFDGKWVTILDVKDDVYQIRVSKDDSVRSVPENQLRNPTKEELQNKSLELRLPELEGLF